MSAYRERLRDAERPKRLDRYVGERLQQFRAEILIRCGAIEARERDRMRPITHPRWVVRPRQAMFVRRPFPPSCQRRFEDDLSHYFTSYAFTPKSFWPLVLGDVRSFYLDLSRNRPGTTLFEPWNPFRRRHQRACRDPKAPKLADFIEYLRHWAEEPIEDLFIAGPAQRGALELGLVQGDLTTFEDLEQAEREASVLGFIDDEILPRPRGPGGRARIDVHCRGGNLGRWPPMLQRLKDTILGRVRDKGAVGRVIAPKHPTLAWRFPNQLGITEFMLYSFEIRRPVRIATRSDLVDAFAAEGFELFDGTRVTRQQWEQWIPSRLARDLAQTLVRHPADGIEYPAWTGFKPDEEVEALLRPIPARVLRASPPSQTELRRMVEEAILREVEGGKLPELAEKHPFPIYVRHGFRSLKEFVDGCTWRIDRLPSGPAFQGSYFLHTVLRPIVDPRRNLLLANFFPDPSTVTFSVRRAKTHSRPVRVPARPEMLDEDDRRLFEAV